ncbi:polysaccharide pyruvyl transferase family protein [Gracilibacillus sp. S3-1-1]|uniref:Polysaccharide pyruvyl transferase family protein n=1 Tax=Gracilibacillus pellucidus TaxID=3095368 RepID=A0ACC6M1K2_9BACI|nr:polysaccharide pyruvyl transferase family protein [Gracilibacillus sp. S3-1-1]MDX8044607.1 polysaccharide pyruvyl transferase family protein [Gracilibacillus sp. S3-1-1]
MTDTVTVLHIASFHGNIGDNANHNGFRRKLKQILTADIQLDELEIREFYQSWAMRDFNSKEFIDMCNQYDLVVIGGGNFFELKWDYSVTGTTINLSEDTLKQIDTPIFFNGLGCDIAKGSSQQTIEKFEHFMDLLTKSSKYLVSVRNDGSMKTLQKLYGDKYQNSIHKVADGAFFMEANRTNFPEINPEYRVIGVNVVSDMKDIRFNEVDEDDIGYIDFVKELGKYLTDFLVENPTYQLVLFPHIYSDLRAIDDVLNRIDDKVRRKRVTVAPYLTGEGAETYIFSLYQQCELILGMRFHSNVCSIAQNIPTIGLNSYKKIHDLYSELNLVDRVIDVNKKDFAKLLNAQVNDTLANKHKIIEQYRQVNHKIQKETDEFYAIVKEWAQSNKIIRCSFSYE